MSAPPPLPRSNFVTVLGRISLLLAGVGLAAALLQAVLALLVGDAAVAGLADHPELPPALVWMLEQRRLLSLLGLLLAATFLASSWGLLRRQDWARWTFIAFLVVTAALNFAVLPLIGQFFDTLTGMFPAEFADTREGREFLAHMRANRMVSMAMATLTAVAFAGLHGWLAWKLCSAAVRAEFRGPGRPA